MESILHTRIGTVAFALVLLSGASATAQEVVLTDGSRLTGTVERYENGFAYIRLLVDGGKPVLTTMPESAVDKTATQQAQATGPTAVEEPKTQTGPFKLPHNDLSQQRSPGIAAVAADEKQRRAEAMGSGAATGRLFRNGQRTTNILTARQIEAVADLREQPKAHPDMDTPARIAGLRFYEARLETLSSAFTRLGKEWEGMWDLCTPITYYVDEGQTSASRGSPARPVTSYRDTVMKSLRRAKTRTRMDDKWSISCIRRDSDFIARGKEVIEAYDVVFTAYADFAVNTGQSAHAVARALPISSRR